jgi:UDP-N-acetylmuramate: L-alanyl-gamma-D-glutamyl-meso-diaminopimelate ligase
VFVYQSSEVKWDVTDAMIPLGALATVHDEMQRLVAAIVAESRPGDHLVLMSNGSFGGLHDRLLTALRARGEQPLVAGA